MLGDHKAAIFAGCAALVLTVCGCGEPNELDETNERTPTGRSETIACGRSAYGSFSSGGMLAAWFSSLQDEYDLRPSLGQKVTVSFEAEYDAEFGFSISVKDANGQQIAQENRSRSQSGTLRFSAAHEPPYKLTVRPNSTNEYIYDWDEDPHTYRWVNIERSRHGRYSVSVSCGSCRDPSTGQSGLCLDTSDCQGTPVAGQCPGPGSIQCCIPSPVSSVPQSEPQPSEPQPSEPPPSDPTPPAGDQ